MTTPPPENWDVLSTVAQHGGSDTSSLGSTRKHHLPAIRKLIAAATSYARRRLRRDGEPQEKNDGKGILPLPENA